MNLCVSFSREVFENIIPTDCLLEKLKRDEESTKVEKYNPRANSINTLTLVAGGVEPRHSV